MGFSVGIVGLPNVGKSTLFRALTKKRVDVSNYPFCTINPNVGVIAVKDPRLEALAKICGSQNIFPTVIEFTDIAGLVKNAHRGEGLGNQFLAHIREADAILEVVRIFEKSGVAHVSGSVNPLNDISLLETELALADLETVTKYLDVFRKRMKAGENAHTRDLALLEGLAEFLKTGRPARRYPYCGRLADFQELRLLTAKPLIYLINISEGQTEAALPPSIKPLIAINAQLECDIADLSGEERSLLGVRSRIDELIQLSHRALDRVTFFTANKNEARTWTVISHTKIPRAGGAIHSDFEKKFIRADVVPIDELLRIGSWAEARKKGMVRSEGKDYIVQEGDVIEYKIAP